MIGDRARMDINIVVKGYVASATVRLDGEPLDSSLTHKTDPAPTLRHMKMRIAYRPRNDRPKYQGRPFVVTCSEGLKNYDSRFRDWADFCHRAESDPMLAFVLKWTQLSEKMFEVVESNSGIDFYFGLDWERYIAHVEKRFEEVHGRKPTAADRMFSYEIEGRASMESVSEYKTNVYEDSKRSAVENQRKKREMNRGGGGNV